MVNRAESLSCASLQTVVAERSIISLPVDSLAGVLQVCSGKFALDSRTDSLTSEIFDFFSGNHTSCCGRMRLLSLVFPSSRRFPHFPSGQNGRDFQSNGLVNNILKGEGKDAES